MTCWKCSTALEEGDLLCEACGADQREAPATVGAPELVTSLLHAPAYGSLRDAAEERQQLWAALDGAQASLATIEGAAVPAVSTVPNTIVPHPRLTSGPDLVAELRAIDNEVRLEVQVFGERRATITANEAEIVRLERNQMIKVALVVLAVVVVIALIAAAL